MTSYLIDTNVVSEWTKPEPNPLISEFIEETDPECLFASVVTLGEIRSGIENLPVGRRRSDLEHWVRYGLPDWFDLNLLPVTREIANEWGRVTVRAKRSGRTITITDGMIAATALTHNLTLVTRNVKDFIGLGIVILNPWEPEKTVAAGRGW